MSTTTARPLGNTSLAIEPLAFGGNVFGWTADEKTSFTLLDHFVDRGFNFIDTADIYSVWAGNAGISETIIGKWLQRSGRRKDVLIATKAGGEFSPGIKGLGRRRITEAIEGSLRRLQTDYIDLYQSHFDDLDTPQEETLAAYADLVKQGKVRFIGASNFTAERLAAALAISKSHGWPAYATLQPEYNLCARTGFESALQPLCVAENIGVITYFSLASGFLTGKYRADSDFAGKARAGGAQKYFNERGLRILAALDKVAAKYEVGPAQIAIAWLLSRPSVAAPIASATTVAQLDDLLAGSRLVLDSASLQQLTAASEE